MGRKFSYSLIIISTLLLSIGTANIFARSEKSPEDCKCPENVKCTKECEEGKIDHCNCKH